MPPRAHTAPDGAAHAEASNRPPFTSPVKRLHGPNTFSTLSGDLPKEKVSQAAQIKNMQRQIGGNLWGFDVHRICQMLSPRTVKPGVSRPISRDHFDYLVDEPFFKQAVTKAAASLESSYFKIQWPKNASEPKYYDPFTTFLNEAVKACHHGLDELGDRPPRSKRWYDKLHFCYSKERLVHDGVDGAAKIKPDIHGLVYFDENGKAVMWATADGTMKNKLLLPVEVKEDLKELFGQSATYARCLFDADPYRRFALVVAFHHKSSHVYFLIFHRSGLTCNRKSSVDISTPDGRTLFTQLFMTLLLWENAQHAGLDMSISKKQILLPPSLPPTATLLDDIYRFLCIRGRATGVIPIEFGTTAEAPSDAMEGVRATDPPDAPRRRSSRIKNQNQELEAVSTPHDWKPVLGDQHNCKYHQNKEHTLPNSRGILKEFWPQDHQRTVEYDVFSCLRGYAAVAQFWTYWEVTEPTGEVVGTHIFLPLPAEAKDAFWDLFFKPPLGHHYDPEYRTMVREIQLLRGESLVQAVSSAQLLDHIQWAAIGWVTIYASGHLHRDISIGNILRIDPPAPAKSVADCLEELTSRQIDHLMQGSVDNPPSEHTDDSPDLSAQTTEQSSPPISVDELRMQQKRLLSIMSELDLGQYSAFVTDGDMAIRLDTYFSQEKHQNELSGTPEFMSSGLRDAIEANQPYLKSSSDDLESLYWVALWAMVFNIHQPSTAQWQSLLRRSPGDRGHVSKQVSRYLDPATHSVIAIQFGPVFKSWSTKLDELRDDWERLLASSKAIPLQQGKFWPFHFHKFAYRGVADILEVVKEHRNTLSQFPSFAPLPGPSAPSQPSSTKQRIQPPLFSRPAAGANVPSSTKRKRDEDDQPESGKKQKSIH